MNRKLWCLMDRGKAISKLIFANILLTVFLFTLIAIAFNCFL